jgi:hypothetical protein
MRTTLLVLIGLALAATVGAQIDEDRVERFVGDPLHFDHCAFVPAAARTLEVRERFWATDLDVVNTATSGTRISIALLARGADNMAARVAVLDDQLRAGETVHLDDVVDFVLVRRWQPWRGGLVVCSEQHPVEVTSRSAHYDRGEQTTYGQRLPGLHLDEAVHPGSTGHLIGLREDEQYRTHVGLLNPLSSPIDVEMRVIKDDGETALLISHDLHPYGQVQLDRLLDRYPIGLERARIELSSPAGPFFAYASMLDNGSNDPTSIPCRVVPSE